MTTPSINGNLLYVTVNSCTKLKDTEWFSRQDPYVCIEYGSNRSKTRTCTDGGKNPTFQEKFVYTLIEGLKELNVNVWNSNIIKHDDFIGSGKVPLSKVLTKGFDDSNWPLQTRNGRHAGEVRLIMEYCIVDKTANNHAPVVQSQPSVLYAPPPHAPLVWYPPPAAGFAYPPAYPPPSPYHSYPPNSGACPPSLHPPQQAPYATQHHPPNPAYPPQPHGSYHPSYSCYLGPQPPPHWPHTL